MLYLYLYHKQKNIYSMVGGFSITPPSVQFSSSPASLFLTRIRQVSIAITFIMLLSHTALAQPLDSVATTGSIRKGTYRLRLGSEEKLHLPKVVQKRAIAAATTRLHRHIFLASRVALDSSGNEDQKVRALVGSSPPKCVKRCGACTPCKSVLVPIHTTNFPATPAEYYPEAWRCQCRGKLYNP